MHRPGVYWYLGIPAAARLGRRHWRSVGREFGWSDSGSLDRVNDREYSAAPLRAFDDASGNGLVSSYGLELG